LLLTENALFLATVLVNPGMPPRDLDAHSEAYLNKVKILRPNLFCKTCKVVYREGVKTEHCEYCDCCIEETDHHCPWSSKCIARRNQGFFQTFLFFLTLLIIFLFTAGIVTASLD